jgi:hypothetical protein
MVGGHTVARGFTSERWRKPLWYASMAKLALFLRSLERTHPGVPIIVGGDGNANIRWPLPTRYIRQRTLADMGRNHYTQLYVNQNGGQCEISEITEQRNASDHDAVVCRVTLGRAA